ncbi:alpha-ribazole phosphatase family protein [Amaricoccus tamworthensis]|uniref:alpha-ribazole phosphatase family protein n=1 Tax=Amaricoccus tamworthensis TaxID=57002 RepID=UPI003C7CA01C
MSLILLRHTRPDMPKGLCYGRTDLLPDAGFPQTASEIARDLPSVEGIVTSPLTRCHMLASHIGDARNLPVETDKRLIEKDFGTWENTPWDDIPREQLDAWAADFLGARSHGGESVSMLRDRVEDALNDMNRSRGPVLWVTHSGVIRAACAILNLHDGWDTALEFGAWLEISPTP